MTLQEIMAVSALEKVNTFKLNFVDEEDLEIIQYVSKLLDDFKMNPATISKRIDYTTAKNGALSRLSLFGCDIADKAESILNNTAVLNIHPLPFMYSCNVKYELDFNGEILKNSGRFTDIKVPIIMDSTASVMFGHELIHLVKETNYEEYVDAYVYSDVIPLLFEMIKMYDVDSPRVLLAERMQLLLTDKKNFDEVTASINGEFNEYQRYIQSRAGEYLNSYYYALILFNMYKSNPREILDYIRLVLNHKITTRGMLMALGIYKDLEYKDVFEEEFDLVKKI